MVEHTFEQLILLSIGISEYDESLGFQVVPSACFDNTTVANYFSKQGFRITVLNNPTKEETMKKLDIIKA